MRKTFGALALALLGATVLYGQALTSLTGTVSDPSGAVVPQVSITIVNDATGAKRSAVSDSVGRYSLLQVEPGTYTVTAQATGFDDVVISKVRLLVSSPATLPITFEKVGTIAQTISVEAETTLINTTDASIGNAVGGKVITQLPFEGRNVVGLLALQPGVVFLGENTPGTQADWRSGAVNGGKSDQANVTLDGVDVNEQQNHTPFTSVLRVTLDSVEEFRTVTTNGGADMGRTSGAQVVLVTKSGTNTLHGSLYELNRNTATEANNFFNNADGIPRTQLIRNVFGASAGGPIKKDRLFLFANYEGRRDRSEATVLRTVPTQDFRNGIFTYMRNDGSIGKLAPDAVKAIDPAHIGADPAVLAIFNKYPLPNDTSVGDALNTSGFRFNAAVPLKWDTYTARADYHIDEAGKHQIFWRGNLQNDNFVPNNSGALNAAGSLPQFPGEPPSSVYLENSKGFALGYTAVLSPRLTSNFHYGYTRQGVQTTGVLNSSFTDFRSIDDLYGISTGLTRIIPVNDIGEDMAWIKGAHSITFGAKALLVNNNSVSFGNSYSGAQSNGSVLIDGGTSLLAPDAEDSTAYKWQFSNLLGLVTDITGRYNYDAQGNVLPQGAPTRRDFVQHDYEFYLQDSWKALRGLTVTAGIRFSHSPAVYEANGLQASPNIPLGTWFNDRAALAAAGESQAGAGELSLQALNAPGSTGLYHAQNDWAPHVAMAYSPRGSSGLSKFLFGGEGKTSIRAGFGMYYDLFGQGLAREYDANELGFATSLTDPVSPLNPASSALTAPRFTGFYDMPTALVPAAPKGGFPQVYPDIFATTNAVDSTLKSPYTMNLDFSVGREFSHGLTVQGAYIGRLSRHSLAHVDVGMPTNIRDPKSGQTYFQAAQQMSLLARANTDPSKVPPIPFFEDLFPGYAGGGQSATQALYASYFQPFLYNETTALQLIDDAGSGCSPCSNLGPNAFYSPQFAGLSTLTSVGGGSYHAMQWTVSKRLGSGLQFDFNYTWSKSIDLGSYGESFQDQTLGSVTAYTGLIQNAWFPGQNKGVSDYDTTHLFSAFMLWELPLGKGKTFLNSRNRIVNGIVGGWQLAAIWRQSSGFPTSIGNGGNWPTDWEITPYATQVGLSPVQRTTLNAPPASASGTAGPNIFANPAAAYGAYDYTLPGESGQRNGIRGDGIFSIDLGLGKRFTLFSVNDHPHTLQFRAEAFNVTNSVRFDPYYIQANVGEPATFGKYTSTFGDPRVFEFSARYEF
jgi:hypothetical protein